MEAIPKQSLEEIFGSVEVELTHVEPKTSTSESADASQAEEKDNQDNTNIAEALGSLKLDD